MPHGGEDAHALSQKPQVDVVRMETREEDVDEEAGNAAALSITPTPLSHRIQRVDRLLRLVSNGDRGEERASRR